MPKNDGGKRLRAAAYARVSTDGDDQANSFESQVRYFRDWIMRQEGWDLVQVYADEGVTGTSTRKREQFNRMIQAALSGKIDVILTKEVSRFARNTLDSISYTRMLAERGVVVVFILDGIDTSQPDAELRLTIMSALAQEESRKTSERVKWGQRRRMEQGVVFGRDMLGYRVRNGRLELEPEGAEAVRLIFHKYTVEGKGSHVIARELKEAGIRPMDPDGRGRYENGWSSTVILRILRNEKYAGDLCQKKTWTKSFLDHKKRYNRGEEETVCIRDHHPEIAIVGRELWVATQAELKRRSAAGGGGKKHSNRRWCSGKIRCGVCGEHFVSKCRTLKDGTEYVSWRCVNHARSAALRSAQCGNGSYVNEKALLSIVGRVIKFLAANAVGRAELKRELLAELAASAERAPDSAETVRLQMSQLESRRSRLVDSLLDGVIDRAEFAAKRTELDARLNSLEAWLERFEAELRGRRENGSARALSGRIDEILDFDSEKAARVFSSMVSEIIVYPDRRTEVYIAGIPYSFLVTYETAGKSKSYQTNITGFDIKRL